jgi:DNA-binding GntR family transcriptional regulator
MRSVAKTNFPMNDTTNESREAVPVDVAARIEQDINIGVLSPGAWLKQIDLERRYDATRLDVRQALDTLVLKRLVTHVPNRGYHVSEFDRRQIDEIFEVRAILEIAAAEQLIAHATDASLQVLKRRAKEFEDATYHGTMVEQNETNKAFHRELLTLCPNRELVELIMDMRQRIPIAVQRLWNSQARMVKSVRDHALMLDAIAQRDVHRLKAITADHILGNRWTNPQARDAGATPTAPERG